MMQDSDIVVAVDVGTSKVCTIIARGDGEGSFDILSHCVVPSRGLEKGNVTDVAATRDAIRESVAEAARQAGVTVTEAYVGVTGSHVSFETRRDQFNKAASQGVITGADLKAAPETVAAASRKSGVLVLHALPRSYTLDGQRGIRNPVGMHTTRLEVETHVVTAASSFVDRLTQAVQQAGHQVADLVLQPIASAEAVLTESEKEEGVALVDIGGGTSDLIVYSKGSVFYNSALPIGGFQFTNDICMTYDTTYEAGEEAKLAHGNTEPSAAQAQDEISLPIAGRMSQRTVAVRDLCQLMRERAQELSRLMRLKLCEAGYADTSSVQMVLTGGTSSLAGLEDMVRRTVSRQVRVGTPNRVSGLNSIPDDLKSPKFATSIGILKWAMGRQSDHTPAIRASNGTHGKTGNKRVSRILSRIMSR